MFLYKCQRTPLKIEKEAKHCGFHVSFDITYYLSSKYNMISMEVSLILKISNLSSISNQYVGVSPKRNVDESLSIFLMNLKINSAQVSNIIYLEFLFEYEFGIIL